MIEILLVVLIFAIITLAFPLCFYKALSTDDPASFRWMLATLGCLFIACLLGITGTVAYGS